MFAYERNIEVLMKKSDIAKNKYRLFIEAMMPEDFDFKKQKVIIYKIYA